MDIATKNPVLYVAIYGSNRAPRISQQWAFLIGPSVETAQSEGVRCGVEPHIDSKGWETWAYNQTIIPLWYEDDLLARIMIAEIRDLAPLGAILCDLEVCPTKLMKVANSAQNVASSSLGSNAWIWKKIQKLEKMPDRFAVRSNALRMLEEAGCRVSGSRCQIAVDELFERVRPKDPRRTKRTLSAIELKTLNFVEGWEKPGDDETNVIVDPNVERGQPITISGSVQIVTGVLGAAALKTRQLITEGKQWLATGEQERARRREPGNGSEADKESEEREDGDDDENEDEDGDGEEGTSSHQDDDDDSSDPEGATEEGSVAKEGTDESEDDEDEDPDEEEVDEEESDSDSDCRDEDEDDGDGDDEDSGDEGDEEDAGAHSTLERVPTTTSSS